MDVSKIREDFPLLKNRDIIYLDNAATTKTFIQLIQFEVKKNAQLSWMLKSSFMRNTMQTRSAVSMS